MSEKRARLSGGGKKKKLNNFLKKWQPFAIGLECYRSRGHPAVHSSVVANAAGGRDPRVSHARLTASLGGSDSMV